MSTSIRIGDINPCFASGSGKPSHSGKALFLCRYNFHRCFLLLKLEVFVKQAVAVVADRYIVGQKDNLSRRMRAGFLFFRWHQIDPRNCSLFLVRGRGLFGWFCATRLVVLRLCPTGGRGWVRPPRRTGGPRGAHALAGLADDDGAAADLAAPL